jgi:hypothetical protein
MGGNVFEYLMCQNQKVEGAIELLRRLMKRLLFPITRNGIDIWKD